MPRGGYREGSGRKPGSKDMRTLALGIAVEATGEGDILSALAEVAEDKLSNVDVRLDACRALSGCLVGRVYSSARFRERINGPPKGTTKTRPVRR
jgi:hypothetical protein